MNKETLEEAIERLIPKTIVSEQGKSIWRLAFEESTKYQQERSYSEEDLEVAYFEGKEGLYSFNDWFEQFKKK